MRFSFSRAECFNKCPYQFFLRYVEGIEIERDIDAGDPLLLGTAVHRGIETDVDTAVREYHAAFPISDDSNVAEEIKIRAVVPKVVAALPKGGQFEVELNDDGRFLGFIDYALPVPGDGVSGLFDLFDFKYTNPKNAERYRESAQLSVYAYYFEKLGFGRVRDLSYIIVPKTMIRQKKTETVQQFRTRLESTLDEMKPMFVSVPYDRTKVIKYFESVVAASNATEYPKHKSQLCDWCDYKMLCNGKDEQMTLPKNERRDVSKLEHVKIWVYGEPFTGKTVFADGFPSPIMLNTDGNIDNVTAPFVAIHDDTVAEGRMTKNVLGWETLKETVADLEKGDHDFETVILDLVEDAYELNRNYIYSKRGWEHESDDSFRAWDIVRKEFFDLMRRITNLPMNVVLISHEDASRDITGRSGAGITAIKPNLPDKVAKKIAGMVDIVGRTIVHDGEYRLTFKTEEFIFGGGRLTMDANEIPTSYSDFAAAIGLNTTAKKKQPKIEKAVEVPAPNEETPEAPSHTPAIAPNSDDNAEDEQTPAEDSKPVRRTRKRRTEETVNN